MVAKAGFCSVLLALVAPLALASSSSAQANPGDLKGTFRCPGTADECSTDALGHDGYGTYDGSHTWTSTGKGPRVTYRDGMFINSIGGITLNLEPKATTGDPNALDRALVVDLPAGCGQSAGTWTVSDVDFRFNANTDGIQGVEAMVPGQTVFGDASSSGSSCATCAYGVVNLTLTNGVSWALLFNNSQGSLDGWFSMTRGSLDTWTIESQATVVVQCTPAGKGKKTSTLPFVHVPFQLTVQKK